MQVQHIMTSDPACCSPNTRLETVARLMVENDCGAIPIVEDLTAKRLTGIVTDRDITCRTLARGKNPMELTAGDCMTNSLTTVSPSTSLEECCRIMEEKRVRRVPVVDAFGSCCGIVSQADIAKVANVLETAEVVREISYAA
jgi:CBS domain-containing protein